ncbi:hypothetical protein D1AOALGA4SA_12210 [Olavius algarvensis Delta 1 endosymbiont]|nr:hypothetical protein D1AOALGA4SA_12210 [Olavius algarvensis Delta 1 endosymbiont]
MFYYYLKCSVLGSGVRVQGSRFKDYKSLIFLPLLSTVWIGHFHPLGETAL